MLKTNIIKVKNYHPVFIEEAGCYASLSSFRMDLRGFLKEYNKDAYFARSPLGGVKNMGCYLFGIPQRWKGVIGIEVNGDEKENTITIYLDHRHVWGPDDIKDILRPALDAMYEEGIIDGYEIIKED